MIRSSHGHANLMQVLDVAPYRGKRVRLRGALRVDPAGDPGTSASLWLRAERPPTQDDLAQLDPPDRGPRDAWTIREVTLEIPVDAALLALGVELTGKGKAHADTLTLDILPPP